MHWSEMCGAGVAVARAPPPTGTGAGRPPRNRRIDVKARSSNGGHLAAPGVKLFQSDNDRGGRRQAWRLTQHNTVTPGHTVRMWYWWKTQDPSGRTVGDWKGPQQAVATPEQLLTTSPHVNTTGNGFVVGQSDIIYSVDITGDDNSSGEFGEFEVWVQGLLQ